MVELNDLFARYGFKAEFFGDTSVGDVSIRQRILRPIKKLAVMLGLVPKTTGGKKWLKRIVFGGLVEMPAEIGPHPSGIRSDKLNATAFVKYASLSLREFNLVNCDSVNLTRQAVTSEFHGAGITQINGRKKAQEAQKCPQGKQIEKDEGTLYRGRYVEPERISSSRADTEYKVIYCVASLK